MEKHNNKLVATVGDKTVESKFSFWDEVRVNVQPWTNDVNGVLDVVEIRAVYESGTIHFQYRCRRKDAFNSTVFTESELRPANPAVRNLLDQVQDINPGHASHYGDVKTAIQEVKNMRDQMLFILREINEKIEKKS